MKFTELPFSEKVLKGIESAGFDKCTTVQEKVLPVALNGCDLMVQSKTGSGKTAVYVLTILQNIAKCIAEGKEKPKALIVAPTRELAVQIEADTSILASGFEGVTVGAFYGGVGYEKQDKIIAKGCDICVGTPGRLLDFQKGRKIDFREFNIFVLDEADRMFDMGFYPDVQKMFSLLSDKDKRQTMLFSATLSTRVRNLAWQYMNEPEEIEVQPEEITVKKITQELYHIAKSEKFNLFLQLMVKENPGNALVFTNTKARAVEVAKRLSLNGFTAKYLMGDMAQSKRLQTINKMKDGKLKFLVATDVAARGLQIDDLELVINYDIPEDFESYVHRIGRTARAGKTGKAITLACEEYIYGLEPIESYIGMKIPVIWPEEGELPEVDDKSKNLSFRDMVSQQEYASKRPQNGRGGNRGDRRNSSRPGSRDQRDSRSNRGPRSFDKKPGDRTPRNKRDYKESNGSSATSATYKKKSTPRPKNAKSYEEIQLMSLEERLAYYKSQYASSSTPVKAKKKKPNAPLQNAQKPSKTFNKDSKSDSSVKAPHKNAKPNTRRKPYSSNGVKKEGVEKKKPVTKKAEEIQKPTTPKKAPKKKGLIARIFKK
jgi:ATP-dependent RNA helicase RhlB